MNRLTELWGGLQPAAGLSPLLRHSVVASSRAEARRRLKPTPLLLSPLILALTLTTAAFTAAAAPQATFYLVDIGHGNVAFVVSPSGETMLLDCGPPQVVDRIHDFMQQ